LESSLPWAVAQPQELIQLDPLNHKYFKSTSNHDLCVFKKACKTIQAFHKIPGPCYDIFDFETCGTELNTTTTDPQEFTCLGFVVCTSLVEEELKVCRMNL
jgi:hypothetical protein